MYCTARCDCDSDGDGDGDGIAVGKRTTEESEMGKQRKGT
jgi:hypothetical protein